jgi:hypothetical protein
MNDDLALIAQLHKCISVSQTSLSDTLKQQIQEFIQTTQPAKHIVLVPSKNKTRKRNPNLNNDHKVSIKNKTRKIRSVRKTQKKKNSNNSVSKNLTRKLKY